MCNARASGHAADRRKSGVSLAGTPPGDHPLFRALMDRRVWVTVETVGEERLPS